MSDTIIQVMIIVLDTNIFVGACLGVGASNAVVRACLRGECQPLMGAALFAEYEDVLGREALFANCRLSQPEREELLNIFLAHCHWTRIYYGWRPNLIDENDNHLIELAVAGGAQYIVTKNLRDMRNQDLRFSTISAMTPEAFLQEITR
jgi:predicted nucleic acid-binding protein